VDDETRVLASRQTKPRVRVIDLVSGTEMPCKLLDRVDALDGAIARSGWIAVHSSRLWWLDAALERPARRLATSGTLIPALDPSCVWYYRDGSWVLYDGAADVEREVLHLGPMVALHAEIPEGLVVSDLAKQIGGLLDRKPPHAPLDPVDAGEFAASSGSRTAWRGEGSKLRIHDHRHGTVHEVHDPRIWRWSRELGPSWSVSPDGSTLALFGEGVFGPLPLDLNRSERSAAKARSTQLALIDLATGSIEIPPERYEDPSHPVWLADGQHITFATPRSVHLYEVTTQQGTPVPGTWTRPPHPLVDLNRATDVAAETPA
jgi:hypothetical protein